MKSLGIKVRLAGFFLAFFLLGFVGFSTQSRASASPVIPDGPVVVRVYYTVRTNLDVLANTLDIWEVNHPQAYLVALVSPQRYMLLIQEGYRVEIDPVRTALTNQVQQPFPGQGPDSIPGFPCYRTVEETYLAMSSLAANHPNLASWMDIGDSWEKINSGGSAGYDINALQLTNKLIPGPKPTFFLMAEIHAREYTTAETATRFAEYLVSNYNVDPDITWLLNQYQVYIVPMTNPDGRKLAEGGQLWRKNVDNDDGCTDQYNWGTDLNRNHTFKWNMGGSSGAPCDEVYHGPSAGSEPEVQAIQNFVLTLFPDQRGPGDTDPAPADATGELITLHSYEQLVLWPWGWSGTPSPNNAQLQTLGRKLAFFNSYYPEQSYQLYQTSGSSDDYSYGVLGIASYTFEMGTDFFQDCSSFESTIYPNNRNALLYAFKAARHPYMDPSGPDSINVSAIPANVQPGVAVTLAATANDQRYNNSHGTEPTQNIAAAHYTIDSPSWITGTVTYPMAATDGHFNQKTEAVNASVATSCLAPGKHTLFVESEDVNSNWGVPGAVFLTVGTGHGVNVSPAASAQETLPGQTVAYPLQVNNLGNTLDTFTVTLTSGWNSTAPVEISNLAGCASAALTVTVDVPGSAVIGSSDVATLVFTSHADPAISATAVLTTGVIGLPPVVVPLTATQAGDPGQAIVYSLSVTNTNDLTDSFNVLVNSTWPVAAPQVLGPFEPYGNANLVVTVTIPVTATGGALDVASVAIASQQPGIQPVTATLTTTVHTLYGLEVSAPVVEQVALPGSVVTYTLYVTNTGNTTDTFDVVITHTWDTVFVSTVGPLAPGQSALLEVVVSVPTDAAGGAADTAMVVIASQGDPVRMQEIDLLTFLYYRINLPIMMK